MLNGRPKRKHDQPGRTLDNSTDSTKELKSNTKAKLNIMLSFIQIVFLADSAPEKSEKARILIVKPCIKPLTGWSRVHR